MIDKPLVTCCIPSYNHHQFIGKAINSVISQTYHNIELIIIDDGSKDSSVNIIESLRSVCDNRFVNFIFLSRPNKGLSKTLNEMISLANGSYITFLASDDRFMPTKIDTLVQALESIDESYAAIFGDAEIVYDESVNGVIKKSSFFKRYSPVNRDTVDFDVTYKDMLIKNFIPAVSALYRKSALEYVGGFSETLRLEDWDMYLKLLHHFKIKGVNIPVAYYYLHGENSIFTENSRLLNDTVEILKREKKYIFGSGFADIWYEKYYDAVINLFAKERKILNTLNRLFEGNIMTITKYFCKKVAKRIK